MPQLGRLYRTLSPLRASQIAYRLRYRVRRALWERTSARVDRRYRERAASLPVARWSHPGLAAVAAFRARLADPAACAATARDVQRGRFRFLNRSLDLGAEVDWFRSDLDHGTRLWKTLLHEFPYALDLALSDRQEPEAGHRARFFSLVESWQRAAPIGCPGFALDAWNARAVSRRLVHWAVAGALLELDGEDPEAIALGREIGRHGLFLRDNLELDLLGNHLMTDAVGLVFANELVGGVPDALSWLEGQVDEQILPDGCHIERAPMYQGVCVQELIEVRLLLGERSPGWLDDALARAAGWLEAVCLGDGDLPLLGDGWLGETRPAALVAEAHALVGQLRPPSEPERHGGIIALAAGELRVVLRAGAHGPDYQLGHAHADLLSFDASIGAHRAISDTGTALYDPGPERDALRATESHNTVQIDGLEQIEAWGSFRVGRRGRARVVSRGDEQGWRFVWACHDAYQHLPGAPAHHRLLALSRDGLLVLDAVLGSGHHAIASRLHLHPDLPLEELQIVPLGVTCTRSPATLQEHFGERREMTRLTAASESPLPWAGGWLILPGRPAGELEAELRVHDGALEASISGPLAGSLRWQPESANPAAAVRISLCPPERGSAN